MRVAFFGQYGIYEPYQSHDGRVGWTVQRFELGGDPEDMGEILAEFKTRIEAINDASERARNDARPRS